MSIRLFDSLTLRGLTLRNRVAISSMCMYSATEGLAEDFHLAHYGRFALGGAGLVMVEATSVSPEGRISHGDLGLWDDFQIEPLARIVRLVKAQGAAIGIQLVHGGRKACRQRPWHGNGPLGEDDFARGDRPWPLVGPSAIPFGEAYQTPRVLEDADIAGIRAAFIAAARRAEVAGFDLIEIHAAHGFLLHSFMCPATNRRSDAYGGDFAGRHRLALEVAADLRAVWPEDRPLFTRLSMEDGVADGRPFAETIRLAAALKERGVDVIDCSSGGIGGHSASTAGGPSGYGFQIPLAHKVREGAGIRTMAVGLITEATLADQAIAGERCDLVAIGREALNDPNWPQHAHAALGLGGEGAVYDRWPVQYGWWLERREKTLRALDGERPPSGRVGR
ncbi:MAG: NADH:flavin oxidoreductase/NADH oxidase [Rhodospirillum sp.]|nr:NADH:flavin oxidoreductase/NADH oxidase [Rhodospirillum sp.]MCF8489716.1 NADH:flavin oxidoreductase/NADH oxidase [Rhodospirillum sp.]MCF8501806.1 NADH:flavin oxidoreductase/NADH oxidase [Rhodospirillum sp.]